MILLFVHTCEEYLCVKDIFDRLEKSITMSITMKEEFGGNLLGYISWTIAHRGWHRFESETLDIRLGLRPIPVPQSIYCLSCVTYSFRDIGHSLLFSNSYRPPLPFSPRISAKEFHRCCNSCHLVPSFLRFVVS